MDSTLTVSAMQAHDAYHTFMRDSFGTPWPRGTYQAHQSSWKSFMAIARLCFTERWDVEDYVKATLAMVCKNHRYILPSNILVDTITARYRKDQDDSKCTKSNPETIWHQLVTELIDYMTTTKRAELAILGCPVTPFPSWFRLVYPETLDPDIMKWFGQEGCRELAADMKLRKYLRTVVPKAMAALERETGLIQDVEVVQ